MTTARNSIPALTLAALAGLAAASPGPHTTPTPQAPEFSGLPTGWSLAPTWDPNAIPPQTCFAEGTDITPELMDELLSLRTGGDPFNERFNINGSRNGGQRNTPVVLTYSYVPDGTPMAGGPMHSGDRIIMLPDVQSSLFSNLDGRFGGNRELWQAMTDSVFARYSELTGITFVRVGDDGAGFPASPGTPGLRGDIRIAMRSLDGSGRVLAFAGTHVTLDAEENWGNYAGTFIMLRNVLSHEVGHTLGLGHVCPLTTTKLMEPIFTPAFDGPRHDDLRALHRLYGDAFEPDNSAATASQMTESLPETSFTFFNYPYADANPGATTASLSGGLDQDWYRSFVGARMPVSVTVTPAGTIYDDSDQNDDGSCSAGNPINSLTAARLAVSLSSADGTLLASAQAPAPGLPVSLSNVSIPAGNYFTTVYCPDAGEFDPQGYTLTRSVGSPQPPSNDACANAQHFLNGPVYGTTFGATADGSGWLDLGGNSDQGNTRGDVYYTFTASDTGRLEAFTTNAGSPPGQGQAVTIHRGCPTSHANQLPIPDTRHYGMGSMYSDVVAGETYTVRVGSAPNRDWGGFTLDLRYLNAPPNDRCENATTIPAGTLAGSTNFARREGGTGCANTDESPTVWYRYTAPYTNTVHITTCGSGWDTVLAAYDSCPADLLHPLACNDDSGCGNYHYTSALDLTVQEGQTILIRVSGYAGAQGNFTLGLAEGPMINDSCATALPAAEGRTTFNNTHANTDPIAEHGCSFCCGDDLVNRDLWYAYTPDRPGTLAVDTAGSSFDTKLAAYAACPSGDSQAIACNDDWYGLQSYMSFPVQARHTYFIRAGAYADDSGDGVLNLAFTPAACPADFNADGFLDFFDYDDFVACFESGSCPPGTSADFNRDDFVDFFDYDDFVQAFEVGC